MFWATVDSPWLHKANEGVLGKELKKVQSMEPKMILSSHLPMADRGMVDKLVAALAEAPSAQPFVGPDQAGLEQMLKEMTEGAQA